MVASLRGQRVFVTGGAVSPAEGGENMAVYIWRPSE
jgi:hypothetical protein